MMSKKEEYSFNLYAEDQPDKAPPEQEERLSLAAQGRHKSMALFSYNRKEMNNEQRLIYDFVVAQIRLMNEFPDYLRQAEDFSFIKMVGKGGFGHVWAANDLKTGKICAIKEMHKIDGKKELPLNRFIREIQTMIAVKSRYVLPIYGYTAELPFSIIMPYMSGNTLNDLLQKGFKNPTQLTIFSMCIAQGLKDIHEAGVVYRDLKTSNILMDNEGYPIICDLGTAKMYSPGKRMTLEIGTFTFMAPEVYDNPYYDKRCDIYSFAMILYEMSEFRVPFRKLTDKERKEMVIKGIRPDFSKDRTPKGLKELIIKCWDGDPDKRPSWDYIIKCLGSGNAYFQGANVKQVKQFAIQMQEEIKNYKHYEPPPYQRTNQDRLIKDVEEQLYKNELFTHAIGEGNMENLIVFESPTIRHHSNLDNLNYHIEYVQTVDIQESSDDETTKNSPHEILRNPSSPDFENYLKFLSQYLKPRQFFDFYQNTISYIRGHWECPQIPLIFDCYSSLARSNPEFLDLFMSIHFFRLLTKKTVKYSYNILAQLIHQKPQLLDDSGIKVFISFLHSDPYEAIYVYGEASSHLQKLQKPLPLFDALMHKHSLFLNHPTGNIFLAIFYVLLSRSKSYRAKRLADLRTIFVLFIDSIHKATALNIISIFYDNYFDVSFESVMDNFEETRTQGISLLMRLQYYPITEEFCQALVDSIPSDPKAFYVLMRFANEGVDQAMFIVKCPKWMDIPTELMFPAIQLFLIVCLNHECRNLILRIPEFSVFIKKIFEINSRTVFVAINAMFKKAQIDQTLLDDFTGKGIIDILIEKSKMPKMSTICVMILQTFSNIGKSPAFAKFVPVSVDLLKDPGHEMITKKAILQLLQAFCSHDNVFEEIINCQPLLDFMNSDFTQELNKYKFPLIQAIKQAK